jgi:hypothetical protein
VTESCRVFVRFRYAASAEQQKIRYSFEYFPRINRYDEIVLKSINRKNSSLIPEISDEYTRILLKFQKM